MNNKRKNSNRRVGLTKTNTKDNRKYIRRKAEKKDYAFYYTFVSCITLIIIIWYVIAIKHLIQGGA